MIVEFPVVQFWWLSHELKRLEGLVRDESEPREGQIRVLNVQPREFDKGLAAEIKAAIDFAEPHCKNLEFQDTTMLPLYNIRAALQRVELLGVNTPDPSGDIRRDLTSLRKTIEMELQKRKFVYVSPENSKYFGQEKLFGEQVFETFVDARKDISNAGDCLAIGLPNPCVFHLMRTAEYGLRALAKRLRVKLTHKGKSCPIEFSDWHAVITACKNKLEEAHKLSKGPKQQAKLEMYSDAADHCTFMKDIWRNSLAHARTGYLESEAVGIFERIRDFMIFLAKQL